MERKRQELKTAGEVRRQREIRKQQNAAGEQPATMEGHPQDMKQANTRREDVRHNTERHKQSTPEARSTGSQPGTQQLCHGQEQGNHPPAEIKQEKRKLFQKPDYNEDMTEYLKQRDAAMRDAGSADQRKIHAADRTPAANRKISVHAKYHNKRKNER